MASGAGDHPREEAVQSLDGYLEHRSALRRYLARRMRRPEDVEDFVQDVFLRVLSARSVEKIGSPRGFLLRIASNLLIDRSRRDTVRMRGQHIPLEDAPMVADSAALSPENIVSDREQLAALQRAVDALPPIDREIFQMARLEGAAHAEIGRRLGMETKVVSRRVERLMTLLARSVLGTGD